MQIKFIVADDFVVEEGFVPPGAATMEEFKQNILESCHAESDDIKVETKIIGEDEHSIEISQTVYAEDIDGWVPYKTDVKGFITYTVLDIEIPDEFTKSVDDLAKWFRTYPHPTCFDWFDMASLIKHLMSKKFF